MSDVVYLTDFRKPGRRTTEAKPVSPSPEELRAMSYPELLDWCRTDFGRLVEAASARGYWPTWVERQLEEYG